LIHCCILLDFLCELYYDARIHEHQIQKYVYSENVNGVLIADERITCAQGVIHLALSLCCCPP
jgi:hypothetical protein